MPFIFRIGLAEDIATRAYFDREAREGVAHCVDNLVEIRSRLPPPKCLACKRF